MSDKNVKNVNMLETNADGQKSVKSSMKNVKLATLLEACLSESLMSKSWHIVELQVTEKEWERQNLARKKLTMTIVITIYSTEVVPVFHAEARRCGRWIDKSISNRILWVCSYSLLSFVQVDKQSHKLLQIEL